MQQQARSDPVHDFQRDGALQQAPGNLSRMDVLRRGVPTIQVEVRELPIRAPAKTAPPERRVESIANLGCSSCGALNHIRTAKLVESGNARCRRYGFRIVCSLMG